MTLVSQVITDAFRQSNILAIGVDPTTLEQTEALRFLNRIVKSVFGNEAGDPFTSFPIGRDNIQRPGGYPWWNTVPNNDWFVPKNTRLILNLESSVPDIWLHPEPNDGSRFAVIDSSKTLATWPIILHGNGHMIETAQSITINTNGLDQEWFFRADLSNWQKTFPLVGTDVFPFPEEFDDFFISMLAMRINPAYGAQMDAQSQSVLQRSRSQLRSRYTQEIPVHAELALIRPARVAVDRDRWGNMYQIYQPNSMFDKGMPW